MKVLFLDIDGVCNSAEYAHDLGLGAILGIDPKAALLVKGIIDMTGCEVVLSSTWRLYEKSREQVKNEVCNFIDVTPDRRWCLSDRGCEVQAWLDEHPEVTTYAILDDDADFHKDQNLFLTSWDKGLTVEIAGKVIDYFNNN